MVNIIHSTQIHFPKSNTLVYYTVLLASALHRVHAASTTQSQHSLWRLLQSMVYSAAYSATRRAFVSANGELYIL
jgi:hypothetical protein